MKPARSRPDPTADCLAADRRRLRALTRELRQLYGTRREVAQAEYDTLLEKSRAAVAARRLLTMIDGLGAQMVVRAVAPAELKHIARSYVISELHLDVSG